MIWNNITNFPNHRVSNTGLVKRVAINNRSEKILKQQLHCGYYRVTLYHDGKQSWYYVNVLVATYFCPNPNNLPEVNHLDGNKLNNNDWNLEWTDRSGNMTHAANNGLMVTKISKSDAMEIRKLFNDGKTIKELTGLYPVSQQTISLILLNKRWKI